jgi:putative ABC transport system ATP-binding protein
VTHDQRLATRCASRLVTMADGRITGERTLERSA